MSSTAAHSFELEHSDTVLDSIHNGWFTEDCELLKRGSGLITKPVNAFAAASVWKDLYTGPQMSVGQKFSLQVEEILAAGKSKFQVSSV